ncbi:hypothetical protein [Mycobacterium nebraskense]|uniref:Uncharacterized protein n=1 Tax=Mycobacterium nebraskense TaxID=244292 RepID=A0A0F5N8F9_9MYCO|nr:hypothetical protein [Mycobacterium nebraskense]KKC03217.1 hypothetical protein WU83_20165 [Mycobacterium nebraskense]KLO46145.1 hypothetical protein ABW17_04795 [Mycobacterium nebraskense]MBI2693230.1 hypothetical protein [Mycobacterium nebraskense]MCV7117858.1 hypothetical protein [Mycobacterium nebraskense]ORW17812.1 hypothetical protein AWC17_11820 [Mycobacterium nebraskense]
MTEFEPGFPSDEAPEGDAAEQLQPVDSDDEAGLDTEYLNVADREANEADVIEQAYVVPTDDEWDDQR